MQVKPPQKCRTIAIANGVLSDLELSLNGETMHEKLVKNLTFNTEDAAGYT